MASDVELLDFLHSQTDPAKFAGVEREFRRQFGFYSFTRWAGDHATEMRQRGAHLAWLVANPNLAQALIFHGDGKVREAALQALKGPLLRPVVAYGLVSRLNDWVPQVRSAATDAFARCFPETPAETLISALSSAFLNARRWQRWSNGYDALVTATMQHKALAAALLEKILTETTAAGRGIFGALCRDPAFDAALPQIATLARQPGLRANALGILVKGNIKWTLPSRHKVWIDKPAGKYKLQFDTEERPLPIRIDPVDLLQTALHDRSARVRLTALDALIARRTDARFHPLIATCLATLPDAGRASIKSRLDYLRRTVPDLTP